MRNDDNSESKKCPQIRESRGPVNDFKRNLPGTVLYKNSRIVICKSPVCNLLILKIYVQKFP